MPDVTISFTDAQWARVVAASAFIKGMDEDGDVVDATYFATKWKNKVERWVKGYEKSLQTTDAWE